MVSSQLTWSMWQFKLYKGFTSRSQNMQELVLQAYILIYWLSFLFCFVFLRHCHCSKQNLQQLLVSPISEPFSLTNNIQTLQVQLQGSSAATSKACLSHWIILKENRHRLAVGLYLTHLLVTLPALCLLMYPHDYMRMWWRQESSQRASCHSNGSKTEIPTCIGSQTVSNSPRWRVGAVVTGALFIVVLHATSKPLLRFYSIVLNIRNVVFSKCYTQFKKRETTSWLYSKICMVNIKL